ncbi:MAG: hypothetical protein ACI9Y1_003457 [Lentisphaeria bacterium]|jgi:hypothetical protein
MNPKCSRRSFLSNSSLTVAAVSVAPMVLVAQLPAPHKSNITILAAENCIVIDGWVLPSSDLQIKDKSSR